jgi:hypothetical protein
MADYSSDESVSDSESDSDCEVQIQKVLSKIPKACVPEVKAKRVYNRKTAVTDETKKVVVDKLQKAREAKSAKSNIKKQADAQEVLELQELKKLKSEGKLKIKKDSPVVKEKKQRSVVVKEIHHYHNSEPDVEPKPARVKKSTAVEPPPTPRPQPKQVRMIFA